MALTVSVVSADAEIYHGEAEMVIAKTVEGEIGLRTGHQPLLAVLATGQVRITQLDGKKVIADAEEGFISLDNDVVTIVAGKAALV